MAAANRRGPMRMGRSEQDKGNGRVNTRTMLLQDVRHMESSRM